MTRESCQSEVGLDFLAEGMAKQYNDYQSALQELIDNAVSGIVESEEYFQSSKKSAHIEVSIIRSKDTVRTIVADNGPGIDNETLREEVFRTGNKSASKGILNNVGWGLKASLSWFESTLNPSFNEEDKFKLVTLTRDVGPLEVSGPITGNLPISKGAIKDWDQGLADPENVLSETPHGTRVHVSCATDQFNEDLWPSGNKLDLKVQALRERLGILFRRLLEAKEENQITISYQDTDTGANDVYDVYPIFPKYKNPETDPEYGNYEFTVLDAAENEFEISYEKGTLDFEAMRDEIKSEAPGLFTSGGNFRTRYRPSQAKQGIDVYANGRVLMTSVFSDVFDLTRNNQYNYFGGILRIIPKDGNIEIPTDNKKTRIDKSSSLWVNIRDKLQAEPYLPVGKIYEEKSRNEEKTDKQQEEPPTESADISPVAHSVSLGKESLFGMHQADSRSIKSHLQTLAGGHLPKNGLVDLTITSPPYADVKDYALDRESQVGFGDSYQEYLAELRDIFSQIYDVTKPEGSLWLVANTFKQNGQVYNLPWDLAAELQNLSNDRVCPNCSTEEVKVPLVPETNNGPFRCPNCDFTSQGEDSWHLQDIAIWDKKKALPYSGQGKLRNVFEYVLFFTKSSDFTFNLDEVRVADPSRFKEWWVDYPERYHPRGKVPSNVWEMTIPSQGSFGFETLDHPAPFPPDLVERILRLSSNEDDTVLDPFAGSGMVLGLSEMLNRNATGFELSQKYAENFPKFRKELKNQLDLKSSEYSEEQQNHLAKIIGGLRQTKQLQRMLLHLAEEQNIEDPRELNFQTVFHISKSVDEQVTDSEQFIESEYIFVVDEGTTPARGAELESMIDTILLESDARKFGISARSKVVTPQSVISEYNRGLHQSLTGELFLYLDSHHRYSEEIQFEEWKNIIKGTKTEELESNLSRFPPIISNIGLNVDNPRRQNESDEERQEGLHEMVQGGETIAEIASLEGKIGSNAD